MTCASVLPQSLEDCDQGINDSSEIIGKYRNECSAGDFALRRSAEIFYRYRSISENNKTRPIGANSVSTQMVVCGVSQKERRRPDLQMAKKFDEGFFVHPVNPPGERNCTRSTTTFERLMARLCL